MKTALFSALSFQPECYRQRVTRLRLATVLTALLALTGGAAGPMSAPASTRLIAAIVQIARQPERATRVRRPLAPCHRPVSDVVPVVQVRSLRSAYLPHSLLQRPPPARA